tara:strand:- start:203 stop:505 length:303 start_codon:yes stop_codon:yes gene_type:complete
MTYPKDISCSNCGRLEHEIDVYQQGENITLYAQTGTLLCPDCIPEQKPDYSEVSSNTKNALAHTTAILIIKHLEDNDYIDWTVKYKELPEEIKEIILNYL